MKLVSNDQAGACPAYQFWDMPSQEENYPGLVWHVGPVGIAHIFNQSAMFPIERPCPIVSKFVYESTRYIWSVGIDTLEPTEQGLHTLKSLKSDFWTTIFSGDEDHLHLSDDLQLLPTRRPSLPFSGIGKWSINKTILHVFSIDNVVKWNSPLFDCILYHWHCTATTPRNELLLLWTALQVFMA